MPWEIRISMLTRHSFLIALYPSIAMLGVLVGKLLTGV